MSESNRIVALKAIITNLREALKSRDRVIREMPSIGDELAQSVLAVTDQMGGYTYSPHIVLAARRNAYAWFAIRNSAEEE